MASLVNIFENDSEIKEDLIVTLKKYVRKEITARELGDKDDFIYEVRTRYPLGHSIIVLDVNEDDFMKSVDITENDIWMYNVVNSYYGSGFEFEDYSSTLDYFLESGNIFNYFDNENVKLLEKIYNILFPLKEFNINHDSCRVELANKMIDFFGNNEDIVMIYWDHNESAFYQSVKNGIDDEFTKVLNEMGLMLYGGNIATTVGDLVLHIRLMNYHGSDIQDLYNNIIDKYKHKISGGWGEDYYIFYDDKYFDNEKFNSEINDSLNKILEHFEENSHNLSEYINMTNRLSNKFKINKKYQIPKDDRYFFEITDIDMDTLKIKIKIFGPKKTTKRSLSEKDFYNFLYVGELFDLQV